MRAIHQFVAGFTNGDAISNEALVLRGIFRSWGFESEIFCEVRRILPELRTDIRDVSSYSSSSRSDDIVLLHLSMGSMINDVFRGLHCRKATLYHNVTPSHFFELINPKTAALLAKGRKQMASLAGVAEVNMADSAFNAAELTDAGYSDVSVLPLVLDLDKLRTAPNRQILGHFKDGIVNVLFVGRCAPNKKIEDVLRTFYTFHTHVEPASRLIHVGSSADMETYQATLVTQAKELGIKAIHFAGSVTQAQLNAFYGAADIFLCMSEHEGFCIPIIESMSLGIPVMAYAAGAVPETMDGAGILIRKKEPASIAEMMGKVVKDRAFRKALLKGQENRITRYRERDLPGELRKHLAPLLDQTKE